MTDITVEKKIKNYNFPHVLNLNRDASVLLWDSMLVQHASLFYSHTNRSLQAFLNKYLHYIMDYCFTSSLSLVLFSCTYPLVTTCHSVSCFLLISTQQPVTIQPPSYGALHHTTVTELPLPDTEGLPAGGSAGPN